jgi:trimethylamine--corrinoid protein Co-methyltransferase
MLQMMQAFMTPMATDQASLGVEAIARVGPGGHFFGDPHTLERYQTAFYEPMLSDWRPYDAWVEHGAQSATERAHGIWKQILAEYQPPAMDEAVREELDAYVARRKEEYARGA